VNVIPGKATYELAQIGRCVEVRINKMTGVDGYFVYRKEGDGSYKKLGSVQANVNGSVTTYYDRSISYAKNYTYYVKAYKSTDATRVAGTASAKKSITTK
jgi:hypothetical protein